MTSPGHEPLALCGVRLDAIEFTDLIDLLDRASSTRERKLILNHNLHSLYLYLVDPKFKASYSFASCVYIDGLPIVWLANAAGLPVKASHRITFLDSFELILLEAAARGWRVFYLGSDKTVVANGLAKLQADIPHLQIAGHHGFFQKTGPENEEILSQINAFAPHILFVGMGMPLQEVWIAKQYDRLDVSAIMTSGATLDYILGDAYKPPAWAGTLGLYGIFRLFSDPRRLWKRYLIEPLWLIKLLGLGILKQRLRGRTTANKNRSSDLP